MSLRAFGLGLSAAAAFSAVAVLEAPVQAASIEGKTLSFTGTANLVDVGGGLSNLVFDEGAADIARGSASASIFGAPRSTFQIGNLQLTQNTATTWSLLGAPIDNWITNLANGIGFTLETFELSRTPSDRFEAIIAGFFTPSGLAGDGDLTAQGSLAFTAGSSFSAEITAIPTPALLPGLVGLGVAAFRKRNGQDSSEQEA